MELPSDDSLRFVVARYAYLRHAYGEVVGTPVLVEPTGRFFPDAFEKDVASLERLFRRTLRYSPVDEDLDFAFEFVDASDGSGGCGTGGCSTTGVKDVARGGVRAAADGGDVVVSVDVGHVADPTLLTTSIARSVGALVLVAASDPSPNSERDVLAELAAVQTGLGLLLLGGSSVYKKACSGIREHRATTLSTCELAVALALFHAVHGIPTRTSKTHLMTTQREAFGLAEDWVASNPELVATLRDAPERLVDGVFEVQPTRGLIARFFARKSVVHAPESVAPARPAASKPRSARFEEDRALVEEAFKKA
ncbi:MAG: hypothetical protein U0169_22305 [Polyangiaceae bacterium]